MLGKVIRKLEDRMSNKTWERWFKIKTMFSVGHETKEFIKLLWERNKGELLLAAALFIPISIALVGCFVLFAKHKTLLDYAVLAVFELCIFFLLAPIVLVPIASLYRKRKDDPGYYRWLVQYYNK